MTLPVLGDRCWCRMLGDRCGMWDDRCWVADALLTVKSPRRYLYLSKTIEVYPDSHRGTSKVKQKPNDKNSTQPFS